MWNVHHGFICSNTWSSNDGTVWEVLEYLVRPDCRRWVTGDGPWGCVVQPHKKLALSFTHPLPACHDGMSLLHLRARMNPSSLNCVLRASSSLQWERHWVHWVSDGSHWSWSCFCVHPCPTFSVLTTMPSCLCSGHISSNISIMKGERRPPSLQHFLNYLPV